MLEVSTTFLDFVRLKNSTLEDFRTILDSRVTGQFEPKCEEFSSKRPSNKRRWMLSCLSYKTQKNQEMVSKRVFHFFESQNVKSAFKNRSTMSLQSTPI